MFQPKTVILAVVLTAPFGLAMHDEFSRDKPAIDRSMLASSLAGEDRLGTQYVAYANDEPTEAEKLAALRAELEIRAERSAAERLPEPPAPPRAAPGSAALIQLFGDSRATLGPALAEVRFGATRDELARTAPTLIAWQSRSDELGRVHAYPEFMTNGETEMSDLVLEIPDPDMHVETFLRERWGAPQIEAGHDLPAIWVSEDGKTRAAVSGPDETISVVFSAVTSVDKLLVAPTDGGTFAFETGPALVGGNIDQLSQNYPRLNVDRYYQDSARLDIPGIASDPGASPYTRVNMIIKSGVVESMSFKIGCGERCADVVTAFEVRFGASKQDRRSGKDSDRVYRFKTTPGLTLTIYGHEHRLVAVDMSR